ncbi:hypothetical protein HYT84_02865 [Candidatus Micrarchaeota archaeon]|nr:hypothetical protein [Candidatus Micrarchaeota archaeon]
MASFTHLHVVKQNRHMSGLSGGLPWLEEPFTKARQILEPHGLMFPPHALLAKLLNYLERNGMGCRYTLNVWAAELLAYPDSRTRRFGKEDLVVTNSHFSRKLLIPYGALNDPRITDGDAFASDVGLLVTLRCIERTNTYVVFYSSKITVINNFLPDGGAGILDPKTGIPVMLEGGKEVNSERTDTAWLSRMDEAGIYPIWRSFGPTSFYLNKVHATTWESVRHHTNTYSCGSVTMNTFGASPSFFGNEEAPNLPTSLLSFRLPEDWSGSSPGVATPSEHP